MALDLLVFVEHEDLSPFWSRRVGPGFTEIRSDGTGSLRFIAVDGWIDVREIDRAGAATGRIALVVAFPGERSMPGRRVALTHLVDTSVLTRLRPARPRRR